MAKFFEATVFVFVVETIGLAGAATGGLMAKTSWVDGLEKPFA